MKFGLCIPHYGKSLSMEELRTTVQMAEGLGFHSVWVSDHVVTPEHLQPTVGPTFYDPFVVLTCAAASPPGSSWGPPSWWCLIGIPWSWPRWLQPWTPCPGEGSSSA